MYWEQSILNLVLNSYMVKARRSRFKNALLPNTVQPYLVQQRMIIGSNHLYTSYMISLKETLTLLIQKLPTAPPRTIRWSGPKLRLPLPLTHVSMPKLSWPWTEEKIHERMTSWTLDGIWQDSSFSCHIKGRWTALSNAKLLSCLEHLSSRILSKPPQDFL